MRWRPRTRESESPIDFEEQAMLRARAEVLAEEMVTRAEEMLAVTKQLRTQSAASGGTGKHHA